MAINGEEEKHSKLKRKYKTVLVNPKTFSPSKSYNK